MTVDRAEPESEIEPDDAVTRRRIGKLLGERRQALPRDRHVTDHTHLDENGDKIEKIEYDGGTIETNLTKLLGAAPSTTSNLEVLELEATIANEGARVTNPHVPATDDVLETLEQWCEKRGLVPAWEIAGDRLEVSDR